MSKHTPTPWIVPDGGIHPCIYTADESEHIASMAPAGDVDEMEANAAFIVRAVNSHNALVAALRQATRELNAIRARDGAPQHIDWHRGQPLQTSSCTHEYWDALTEECFAALRAAGVEP